MFGRELLHSLQSKGFICVCHKTHYSASVDSLPLGYLFLFKGWYYGIKLVCRYNQIQQVLASEGLSKKMKSVSKIVLVLILLLMFIPGSLVHQGSGNVYASGEGATPFLVPAQELFPTATPHADGSIHHTVASGETLVAIAQVYGVDLQELLAINNLQAADIIHPGDVLVIQKSSAEAYATQSSGMANMPGMMGSPGAPTLSAMVQGTPVVFVEGTAMLPVNGTLQPEIAGTSVASMMQLSTPAPRGLESSPTPTMTLRALLPDTSDMSDPARSEAGVLKRVFSGQSKYLGLGVLALVLFGLFLLVISTRRMRS